MVENVGDGGEFRPSWKIWECMIGFETPAPLRFLPKDHKPAIPDDTFKTREIVAGYELYARGNNENL